MKTIQLLIIIVTAISFINAYDPITGSHAAPEYKQKISSPTPQFANRRQLFETVIPKNSIGAEIGVGKGNFSQEILATCEPKELYLIDCWEHQDTTIYDDIANVSNLEHLVNYEAVKDKFKYDFRVETIKEYSVRAADLFPDEYFDWIFIDANNSYSVIKDDLEAWLPKIKKGGFLCGHNYVLCDIKGGRFGVVPAVNEFVAHYGLEISHLSNNRFAMYMIPIS